MLSFLGMITVITVDHPWGGLAKAFSYVELLGADHRVCAWEDYPKAGMEGNLLYAADLGSFHWFQA